MIRLKSAWPCCLLLLIPVSCRGFSLSLHGPAGSGAFGDAVVFLLNGNFVVTDPFFNAPGPVPRAGAVYLYDGVTLKVIATLQGTRAEDHIGWGGVTVLNNGDFVVGSPFWSDSRGAVTLVDGATGLAGGAVTPANSLVGSAPGDRIGIGWDVWEDNGERLHIAGITALPNSAYVVVSPYWNDRRGAATWCRGGDSWTGAVSIANSLIGGTALDLVGTGGVTVLSNGSWVVASPGWGGGKGAATWGAGGSGSAGVVSEENSLIGGQSDSETPFALGDAVGVNGVTALTNGNYVVKSPAWNQHRGAATWGAGTGGARGRVSVANSLTGSMPLDWVGGTVTPLPNGNYVVSSSAWNDGRGAVTWGNGASGAAGAVSKENSLVGSNPEGGPRDNAGEGGVTVLTNGNYVVSTPDWSGGQGAVTWGNGAVGVSGNISASNSLVGSGSEWAGSGGTVPLSNGNYVVSSPFWSRWRGAVTWGDGASGIRGGISPSNSLVGVLESDSVGSVVPLGNGNYVIDTPAWGGGRGAVTLVNGVSGVSGQVTPGNSLVGERADDQVGMGGVWPIGEGRFAVSSAAWNKRRGAVTWSDGVSALTGVISPENSLTGELPGDSVGYTEAGWANEPVRPGVTVLGNGNFVVRSRWRNAGGAVTWCPGTSPCTGMVSERNSLTGGDEEGIGSEGIKTFRNGNYLVISPFSQAVPGEHTGILTPGDGLAGTSGVATSRNSIADLTSWRNQPLKIAEDPLRPRIVVHYYEASHLTVIDYRPALTVMGNQMAIADGGAAPVPANHTDFGVVGVGGSSVRTFTAANSGVQQLHFPQIPCVTVDGSGAADFQVTAQPLSPVAGSGSTEFKVGFTPSAPGLRKAWVNISTGSVPFRFAVQGTGGTVFESWRAAWFGPATEGIGVMEDFDSDGVPNLLEFAFGTRPDRADSGPVPLAYGERVNGGQPICRWDSGKMRALFARRTDHAAAGLDYTPQFSSDLAVWLDAGNDGAGVLAAADGLEIVAVPFPSDAAMRFFRVRVSSPAR